MNWILSLSGFDPYMLQDLPAQMDHGEGVVVAVGDIVALISVAAADKDAVGSLREGPEHMSDIDPTRAHDADKPHFGCILQSGHASQVSSAVRSPMADEAQDFQLRVHSDSPPSKLALGT